MHPSFIWLRGIVLAVFGITMLVIYIIGYTRRKAEERKIWLNSLTYRIRVYQDTGPGCDEDDYSACFDSVQDPFDDYEADSDCKQIFLVTGDISRKEEIIKEAEEWATSSNKKVLELEHKFYWGCQYDE